MSAYFFACLNFVCLSFFSLPRFTLCYNVLHFHEVLWRNKQRSYPDPRIFSSIFATTLNRYATYSQYVRFWFKGPKFCSNTRGLNKQDATNCLINLTQFTRDSWTPHHVSPVGFNLKGLCAHVIVIYTIYHFDRVFEVWSLIFFGYK